MKSMDNVFQSPEWEELKLATGYTKSYRVNNVLILQRNLPLGFSMLYSPMVDKSTQSTVLSTQFKTEVRKIGEENNSIFYRLELDVPVASSEDCVLSTENYAKSFEEMQPEHTLILDLTKSEAEILAQMKSKGRYNIKVAEKNNLTVGKTNKTGPELDSFFNLYSATAKRHKISYRAKKYFDSLLEILGKSGYAELFTVYLDERPLASAIIIYSDRKAIYLYGASSDEYKNLMAPYQLHFEIIKEARSKGFETYDFFGIAPEDAPNHPWVGVTRFKKQFGGTERQIYGSYDLILKPIVYKMFKMAEKIRRRQVSF
ncbi:MAG: peptidoglycan bridge formation glycyltransferase FemA/FemB family protein [bacterium]|nr:peptidoglycan bridge formation glycyltransferase FemA/FemB family protein [bacterium]